MRPPHYPYDPPPAWYPQTDPARRRPAVRPRDAATMLLVRNEGKSPRILMGQRSRGHDVLPDKFVFPGGRVETSDARTPALSELGATCKEYLTIGARRHPRTFALTAIRETFEETGLIIGRAQNAGLAPAAPDWEDFFGHGVAPCLKDISFLGRIITPPYRPKRFDARFFIADADKVLADDRPPLDGAELINLNWFTFEEAAKLDLPSITRFVLGEAQRRLEGQDVTDAPFLTRWVGKGGKVTRLQDH